MSDDEITRLPERLKVRSTVIKTFLQEGFDVANDPAVTIAFTALSATGIDWTFTALMGVNSAAGFFYRWAGTAAYERVYPRLHPHLERLPFLKNKPDKPQIIKNDTRETWQQSAAESAIPRVSAVATFLYAWGVSGRPLMSAGVAVAAGAIKFGIVFGLKRYFVNKEWAKATQGTTTTLQTEGSLMPTRRQRVLQRFMPRQTPQVLELEKT